MKLRSLREDEVTFTFEAESEDIPLEGHFDSGDAEADAEMVAELRQRLERGDIYAWFCAKVTASWKGYSASDYGGGCSYENEKDFLKCDYYSDLKARALDSLNKEIQEAAEMLSELEEK